MTSTTTMTTTITRTVALALAGAMLLGACGRKEKRHDQPAATADAGDGDGGDAVDCAATPAAPECRGEGDGQPRDERDTPLRRVGDDPRNDAVADFRGFFATNAILTQRLMADERAFFLGTYLDSYSREELFGLPQLLGYDVGSGLRAEFRNGKANAINMVLWHLALSTVARDMSFHCAPPDSPTGGLAVALKPAVLDALRPLCAWPAPEARATASLQRLWSSVMAHDAPRTEFEAFRVFFQGTDWDGANGAETVQSMLTAMLYNPHFLVRK